MCSFVKRCWRTSWIMLQVLVLLKCRWHQIQVKLLFHFQSYSYGTVTLRGDCSRIQISGVLERCIVINFHWHIVYVTCFKSMTSVIHMGYAGWRITGGYVDSDFQRFFSKIMCFLVFYSDITYFYHCTYIYIQRTADVNTFLMKCNAMVLMSCTIILS